MTSTPTRGHGAQQSEQPGRHGYGDAADGALTVRVRYFAGAAAAAGTDEEVVVLADGGQDVSALRERMVHLHPSLERVLAVATLLVDEVSATSGDAVLGDGARVDVLPPFAGG